MSLTSQEKFSQIFGNHKQERGVVYHRKHTPPKRATHLACPMLKRDSMPPTKSMLDGATYESKSQYAAHLAQHGCTVIEEGMPTRPSMKEPTLIKPEQVKEAYAKAHADLGLGAI